jgi:uracil-DNA glycosylase
MDRQKALRRSDAVVEQMDTFIISQALAESQLRKSGVNFFTMSGELGNSGKNLEIFLNLFERTVFPPNEIHLRPGVFIPKCKQGFSSVYNTEITQCFPGKSANNTNRSPTSEEIIYCISQNFLFEEIKLIEPKLILLMGNKSRKNFYRYCLQEARKDSLSKHLDSIRESGVLPKFRIGDLIVNVLPIQHASGANPNFRRMLNDKALIESIKAVLH